MIPSNPNPPMTREEIKKFRAEMSRRMKGDFTPRELQLAKSRNEVYQTILKRNGGKNPLFSL